MKTIKLLFIISTFLLVKYGNSQSVDSILYHNDTMESQWFGSMQGNTFGCFVRFTPTSYPDTLVGVRGFFREATSNSTIRWKVYFDTNSLDSGGVTQRYLSPAPIPNPAAGGPPNQTFDIYTDLRAAAILVKKGDVYLGAVEDTGEFGMGIDTVGNIAINRQWQWETIFSDNYWNTMTSELAPGQLGITAFFSVPVSTGLPDIISNSSYAYLSTADNILHVLVTSVSNNPLVKIYDVSGRQLAAQNLHVLNTSINMNGFATGVYIVNIISDNGSSCHKVIKL
jgi:Secretion system C-terminal sorting domain